MFAYCTNDPVSMADSTGSRACYVCMYDGGGGAKRNTQRDVTEEINRALAPYIEEGSNARSKIGILETTSKYLNFYYLVRDQAPWDIKRVASWRRTIRTPYPGFNVPLIYENHCYTTEQLGNYTYGRLGRAYGIPLLILLLGSYAAADFPIWGDRLINEMGDQKIIIVAYFEEVCREWRGYYD